MNKGNSGNLTKTMTNNYLYGIEKNNNEFVSNEYSDTIKYLDGVLTEEGIEQVIAQNKKVKKAVIVFSMDILILSQSSVAHTKIT